jgi:hypothetical protein
MGAKVVDDRADRILADVVTRVKGMKGGPGINVVNGPQGITISLAPTREHRPHQSGGSSTDSIVVVEITSAASGGGKYNGKIIPRPASDVAATGDLAELEIGNAPDSDDCLIENLMEVGQSTHELTHADNTYQKFFIGMLRRTNTDGMKVVAINGFWFGCEESDDDEVIDGGGW